MSLAAYKIFITVANLESFAHAAEKLNLTPSAISHAIAKLETEFGFSLFIRNKSKVVLTEHGKYVLPYVFKIINEDEKLMQLVRQVQGLEAGIVRIGAFNSVCVNWIPGIVNSFRAKYPQINIEVQEGGYDSIIQWLKEHSLELGFVSLSSNETLHIKELYQDEIVCVTPKNFCTNHPLYVTKEDIEGKPFIMQRGDYGTESRRILSRLGIEVASSSASVNDESIIAMIEGNLGISFLPKLALKRLDYDVNVYSFQPKAFRTIGIGCISYERLSPAAKAMYQHILDFSNSL